MARHLPAQQSEDLHLAQGLLRRRASMLGSLERLDKHVTGAHVFKALQEIRGGVKIDSPLLNRPCSGLVAELILHHVDHLSSRLKGLAEAARTAAGKTPAK